MGLKWGACVENGGVWEGVCVSGGFGVCPRENPRERWWCYLMGMMRGCVSQPQQERVLPHGQTLPLLFLRVVVCVPVQLRVAWREIHFASVNH